MKSLNTSYHLFLIALGANISSSIGGPAASLRHALDRLAQAARLMAVSRFYESPAFPAGSDAPRYVNAAAALEGPSGPEEALALLHRIEAEMGRHRGARWESRGIDLDLVAADGEIRPDAATLRRWIALAPEAQARAAPGELILPHPRMAERAFVLLPLAEIAPGWRHPLDGRSVAEMLAALPEAMRAEVRLLDTGRLIE